MSRARPVFKGMSLMLTRRIRNRTFLLRPSKRTNQIMEYVVASMARKWNIALHAITVLSNHWHCCLSDPDGNIVEFQRDCHQFIARALNCTHGEFESIWASDGCSRVECADAKALIKEIAYTMANPVEAGLVRHGHSWPGLRRAWPSKPRVIRRPSRFFRGDDDGGAWPEQVVLEFARPVGFDHLSDDELGAVIRAATDRREDRFRREHDRAGKAFVGRKAILAQSRHARPPSREPRFGLNPRVAARNKWRRIERLNADKRWHACYYDALPRWTAGDRSAVFPYGTYKMRVVHGVTCAPAPG